MSAYDFYESDLPIGVLYLTSVGMYYVGVVLLALALSCGLFYLAELAEEYTMTARKVIRINVISVATIFLALGVVDGLSPMRCILGVVGQAVYYQLLRSFPWVQFTSPWFILSGVVCVLNHVLWYSFFLYDNAGVRYPFWLVISFFFLNVWSTPLGYFVTLAISDQQLPAGFFSGSNGANIDGQKRRSFLSRVSGVFSGLLPSRGSKTY